MRGAAAIPRFVRVALAAVLVGLAGGCSNNPYPTGDTAGNTLYIVQSEEFKTLDPTVSYAIPEGPVVDCIYLSYFKYHHLKQSPYVLQLALGETEPVRTIITVTDRDPKTGSLVSHSGEEWAFRIRRGVRFQNDSCFPGGRGREITAADFAYSFRRMTDPKLACPVLSFFQDKVVGMDDLVKRNADREKANLPADWATCPFPGLVLDPADPYSFRIRLTQPYPQLRYLMAMHFTTPLPHEAVERYGADFGRHPVGCGSFQLGTYLPRQIVELVKNPNRMAEIYPTDGDPGDREAGLLEDAGKALPLVDRIVFSYQKEGLSVWNLFQQGYLDSAGVSQDNYSQVLTAPGRLSPAMAAHGVRLRQVAVPNTFYYAFNMKDPVWGGYDDRGRKLRQAISLCIDREQYVDVVLQGQGKVAESLLPPGIFGYEESYRNPYGHTDVELAKRLLADAGYPGGIDPKTGSRLTLTDDITEGGVAERQSSLFLKNQIERCGVQLVLQSWPRPAWIDRVKRSGHCQFHRYSWYADYPDSENFFQLFYSPNLGGVNVFGYSSPEYDRLFEQMRAMDDGPARMAIIRRLRDILSTDCVWIYNCHAGGYALTYDWVHDDKPHGAANDAIRYVRVDGARRAALQRTWNRPNVVPLVVAAALLLAGSIPAAATVRARRNRSVRRRASPSAAAEGGES